MKSLCVVSLVLCIAMVSAVHFEPQQPFGGKAWVVLVAGSHGWGDYGFQANIYHAYHIAVARGVPKENIIVFHYDDIAANPSNPTPGVVVNTPNGTDVYAGVPKDYTGKDHTVKNFFAALKGDQELAKADKKVVNSTLNDHIFVYFIDHGAPGYVLFPKEQMHNTDLIKTLTEMNAAKRFAKLVFYLEACESGSMFEKVLPNNINVYGMTSTNSTELGWNCCRDTKRQAWVSSYFGYYWYKNWQSTDFVKETLQDQFEYLHNTTNQTGVMEPGQHAQHAHQWGDLSITKLPASQFQGPTPFIQVSNADLDKPICNPVNTREMPVQMLEKNIEETNDMHEKLRLTQELKQLLAGRQYMDSHLRQYVSSIKHLHGLTVDEVLTTKQTIENRVCYRQMVDTFNDNCFNINQNTYALGKMNVLINICEQLTGSGAEQRAVFMLSQYCQKHVHQYPIEIK